MQLEYGDLSWSVRALIDTGAPYTIFDRASADALYIDLDQRQPGVRRRWHRIAGGDHQAQVEMVVLRLPPFEDLWWETEVDFLLSDLSLPFAGLLGQQGFLDRWVVTFNRYENYLIVEEPESFKSRLPSDETRLFEAAEIRDLGWKSGAP